MGAWRPSARRTHSSTATEAHLYIEAVSRDPSIAGAAFEGAAVAVRPRAAGRATIAVTATDAHEHAAVATFDIDVREPAASDPTAELAGDTLTVSFTAFYELDEHRAYEVAFRQKSPRGPWHVHCIDTHNSSDSSGDRDVSTRIDVGAHFEPGVTYEVVYRRVGYFCIIARYAPVWSRVAEVTAPGTVAFDLDLRFVGPAPATQRAAIAAAADEWTQIIRTSLPDVDFWSQRVPAGACLPGQPTVLDIVDDLRVYVRVQPMDGVGGTLALARTCYYRQASGLPILSAITFDGDDLALRSTEETRRVAMHELAHALGFGMQWYEHSRVRHPSLDVAGEPVLPTPDAHFTGRRADRAFAAAGGQRARGIPVENTGGPGSMDSHWRESVLGSERMTPTVLPGEIEPLRAITIPSLADLGYRVDASRAEASSVPARGRAAAPRPKLRRAAPPVHPGRDDPQDSVR